MTRGGAVLLDQETKDKFNPETDRKKYVMSPVWLSSKI